MKEKRNYRFCAGGLLLLLAVIFGLPILDPMAAFISGLVSSLIHETLILTGHMTYSVYSILILLLNRLYMISLAVLGVMLLAKVRGKGLSIYLAILSASCLVMCILTPVMQLINAGRVFMPLAQFGKTLCYTLSLASLLVVSLSVFVPAMQGMKKLWFLPGVLFCVTLVLYFVTLFTSNPMEVIAATLIMNLVPCILSAVGMFLAPQWIVAPEKKKLVVPYRTPAPQQPGYRPPVQPQYPPQPQYQPQYQPQPVAPGVAQELERYKQLLDSGAITPEEYETVKKRLLG